MKKKQFNKAVVETTGSFSFIDPYTGDTVNHKRPSLVSVTPFIEGQISVGALRLLLPNLPPEADRKDFEKYMKECGKDKDLLLASFASKFGLNQLGQTDVQAEKIKNSIQKIVKKAETAKLKDDK